MVNGPFRTPSDHEQDHEQDPVTTKKTHPPGGFSSWPLGVARGLGHGHWVLLVVMAGFCSWLWWGLARGLPRGCVGLAGGLGVLIVPTCGDGETVP